MFRFHRSSQRGEASLGLQEGLKWDFLEERLLIYGRRDLPGLGSELPLASLVGLGLGFTLGYRDPGLLPSGSLERRSWGRRGLLQEGLLMLAVSPILASSTGAAPGVSEIIAILLRGKGEPGSVREVDNQGEIFS